MSTLTPTDRNRITAVILAGGTSTRMGARPKALIEWRGRHFIEHIIERLQAQAGAIAISSSQRDLYEKFSLPVLPDPFPDRRGPLAGMLAGLEYSRSEFTLFVPCDNPVPTAALSARLMTALINAPADIAYAASGGDQHYLYALLRTTQRDALATFLDGDDYAVRRWYAMRTSVAVNFDDCAESFLNINTPDALTALGISARD